MSGVASINAERTLALTAALARLFARPIEAFGPPAMLGPLDADTIGRLAADPAFARPINRAVAESLGLDELAPAPATLQRINHDGATRLSVVLAVEARRNLEAPALLIAAGILHRRLLRQTLKTDRDRSLQLFGAANVQMATREAPLLYGRLAELDIDEAPASIFDAGTAAEAAREMAVSIGVAALVRLAASADPALGRLAARRHSIDPAVAMAGLQPPVRAQMLKLIQQGVPSWSDLIA